MLGLQVRQVRSAEGLYVCCSTNRSDCMCTVYMYVNCVMEARYGKEGESKKCAHMYIPNPVDICLLLSGLSNSHCCFNNMHTHGVPRFHKAHCSSFGSKKIFRQPETSSIASANCWGWCCCWLNLIILWYQGTFQAMWERSFGGPVTTL